MMTDVQAIMPILIVTLTAIVTMVAEAFQPRGERVPLGGLGLIGLTGAAIASMLLWGRDLTGFGVMRADNFALFINVTLCIIGILTILFSGRWWTASGSRRASTTRSRSSASPG